MMENFLYPQHTVRCFLTGLSECGKSVSLTNLIFNLFNEYDKTYIYSPSVHQDLYQKLIKGFSSYIPINVISNNLNEEDIDVVIDEIVNDEKIQKSATAIESYDKIKELKFPQE